jgi:hypothetical protein
MRRLTLTLEALAAGLLVAAGKARKQGTGQPDLLRPEGVWKGSALSGGCGQARYSVQRYTITFRNDGTMATDDGAVVPPKPVRIRVEPIKWQGLRSGRITCTVNSGLRKRKVVRGIYVLPKGRPVDLLGPAGEESTQELGPFPGADVDGAPQRPRAVGCCVPLSNSLTPDPALEEDGILL